MHAHIYTHIHIHTYIHVYKYTIAIAAKVGSEKILSKV